jgi:hypothetical protein
MPESTERFAGIQRAVLGTFRSMFMTRMGAFTVMQDQMEKLIRTLAEKAGETHKASWKVIETWFSTFRKAQTEFQKVVEDSFKRAEDYLDRTEGE